MPTTLRLLFSAALTLALLPAADPSAEIKAALLRQQDAWNRGDLRAFMREYLPSAELTFVGQKVTRGWQATLERYEKTYPTPAAMGHLTFSELEVHPLDQKSAWVMGRFHLARTAEGGGDASGRFTLVLQQTKDGWKIVLDHTSADLPAPKPK
ncbi:MAG: DUF4440 domain-containing protein [Bryobacteraceae bacterium]|nr:DUF4440 domain-containing protein [Bryobacteraceae bacterium]